MTGTRADNQNHGYAVGLTSSWFQHGSQKQEPGWIAGCSTPGLAMMFLNKVMVRIITIRRGYRLSGSRVSMVTGAWCGD